MTASAEAPAFPDEVVTRSLLRFVDLPLGAGTAAVITLDNGFDHTKPNTLGPATLLELEHSGSLPTRCRWTRAD